MLCGCCLILINTLREIQVPLPPVRSSQNLSFSPIGYANYSISVQNIHLSMSVFRNSIPAKRQSDTCKHVRPDILDFLKSSFQSDFLCRKQKSRLLQEVLYCHGKISTGNVTQKKPTALFPKLLPNSPNPR